jgi:serine/threonine protein kinase
MADLAMDKPMLGDYRIEGIVGVGRMGVVYLAIDRITGRAVALKVLREDVGIDPVYRERFRREGELLSALEHPHVLPIYGMGEADGELFIAMRLVSSTLRSAISNKPIPVDGAMKILACVASALDAAHAAGVVHRDVKPANVLIDPNPGEVYLGDFGLARDPEGTALTAPGQVLGTIDYMAPELLDGERVGAATDIYGLACLAIETLTGTVPYLRDTDAATMYAHIVDPPPSVSERRPELPAALDDVLATGMAKDPDDRQATAGTLVIEMLDALGQPAPSCLAPAA